MKSKEQKRQEAQARNAKYASLGLQQKLDLLPPSGAKRQRAKLGAQRKGGAK